MRIFTAQTNSRISEITARLTATYKDLNSKPCFVFCEDKNTLSLESEIAKVTGGSFNITVTSLSRYLSGNNASSISKTGSTLAVFKIMQENADSLMKLKIASSAQIAKNIYELIAQLKSAKVTVSKLEEICDKTEGAFSLKIKDIALIYRKYEQYLEENNLYDNNNLYATLPQNILSDKKLRGAKVIVSGFSSVTKQIIDCFLALSMVADVDFVSLFGDGSFYTNETYYKIVGLFPHIQVVADTARLPDEKQRLKDWLFNPEKLSKVGLYDDKVRIFQCLNPYSEAETVAKRIRYEVVKNGLRYRDFCIATSDVKGYGEAFSSVFADYDIPLYVDTSQSAFKHPLMRVIISALDAANKNYKMDAVFNLVRQRALFSGDEAQAFEKYVLKNAVSPKQLKSPFVVQNIDDILAENVRKAVIDIIGLFKKKATVDEFVSATRLLISRNNVLDKLVKLGELMEKDNQGKIHGFNELVIKNIENILSELEKIMGGKIVKLEEFKSLVASAFDSTEISILPLYNDNVFMGDFKSVKQRTSGILFAVGLDSSVPSARQDTAILTDRDLMRLDKLECEIEPKIQVVNKRERENIGVCLMSFSDKLFITYPTRDFLFNQVAPSEIISYLKSGFNITPMDVDQYRDIGISTANDYRYFSKKQAIKRLIADIDSFREGDNNASLFVSSLYQAKSKDKDIGSVLQNIINPKTTCFQGEIAQNLSASLIETYFKCPYSCFLKYNLRLKRDESGEVDSLNIGLIMHAVMELFVAKIKNIKDGDDLSAIACKVFDTVLSDEAYARYLNKSKYQVSFEILKNEAVKMCRQVYNEYKNSLFEPYWQEVAFGFLENSKYPPIVIKAQNGKKMLSGVVDRIDKHGNHLRIIDYKTGGADSKDNTAKFYSGCNIQLYLYANAFLREGDVVGAYYYSVENAYKSPDDKGQSFFGKTVKSDEVFAESDVKFFEKGKISQALGVDLVSPRHSESMLLSQSEMKSYVKYAKAVATVGANEIASGHIPVSPTQHSCEYCEYKGICGFDGENQSVRIVDNVSKTTIVNAVEEQDD